MWVQSKCSGFTLIELLVVMAIIGILAATAIPQYQQYRERGFDTRASSDLRNIAIAQEAYFLDNEAYFSCSNENCTELPGIASLSKGVTLGIVATEKSFTGTASHPKGSGITYQWDSTKGGLTEQ